MGKSIKLGYPVVLRVGSMEADQPVRGPQSDVARLVSSPSSKSRPASQPDDSNYGAIAGLEPWFTAPKFTELATKTASKQDEPVEIVEASEKETESENVVAETNDTKTLYRVPRHVVPKVKKILPKISKVPSSTPAIHILAPMSEIVSLSDSRSIATKSSLINSTSKHTLPTNNSPGEEYKVDEFSIASKISNSLSSSIEGSVPYNYNAQQSSLHTSSFHDVDLLPTFSKKNPNKFRGNMLQSNSSYVKKHGANSSLSQSLVNDSEIMTSSVADLKTSSILSCSNKPNNEQEINNNPIVHMVHSRVTGWMLTSTSRRQKLVGMLDNTHHSGVPTEIYFNNSTTDVSTVSRVRERQVNSWHSQVSRTLQARESVPDCKSTVRSIKEKLLATNTKSIREKGALTTLLNKKLDRVDIIANAKQIRADDMQPPTADPPSDTK